MAEEKRRGRWLRSKSGSASHIGKVLRAKKGAGHAKNKI